MADSVHELLSAWGKKGGESRSAKKREAARRNITKARASIGAPKIEPTATPEPTTKRTSVAPLPWTPTKETR